MNQVVFVIVILIVLLVLTNIDTTEGYTGRQENPIYMETPTYTPPWYTYSWAFYDPIRYKYGYWPYYRRFPYVYGPSNYYFW